MQTITRRNAMKSILAFQVASATSLAGAQSFITQTPLKQRAQVKLASKLRIVIPANEGGGWDQTGRALGNALISSGGVDLIEYENKGGKGGILGLDYYAQKYQSDANTIIIGGMVMVGAVALNRPAIDMSILAPIARLTSDYLVIVVAANSPIKSVSDLANAMKADIKAVPVAGGSAGGVDHIFAGAFARNSGANPEELVYIPNAGGVEVITSVLNGKAVVGISGLSEFSAQLAGGQLRAIGVSSRRAFAGIASIREQGGQLEMANWRGVFTGKGVSNERQSMIVEAVRQATAHESWKNVLKQNRWDSSWLSGRPFAEQIDFDTTTARVMVHLLKLKA